jgi:hypothetical protein
VASRSRAAASERKRARAELQLATMQGAAQLQSMCAVCLLEARPLCGFFGENTCFDQLSPNTPLHLFPGQTNTTRRLAIVDSPSRSSLSFTHAPLAPLAEGPFLASRSSSLRAPWRIPPRRSARRAWSR